MSYTGTYSRKERWIVHTFTIKATNLHK